MCPIDAKKKSFLSRFIFHIFYKKPIIGENTYKNIE
jgi:hypothetical protein